MGFWRFMGLERMGIYRSLALDEIALDSVSNGGDPIIRFWLWDHDSACIGRFQNINDEIDLYYAYKNSISITRRGSGGGAVYNGKNEELVYSIISKNPNPYENMPNSFEQICNRISKGLSKMGIFSEFTRPNIVAADGRKISGNSKWVRKGASLQHGTILYAPDRERMENVLNLRKSIDGDGVRSVVMPVTGIKELCDADIHTAYHAICSCVLDGMDYSESDWTVDEINASERLIEEKYRNREWIFSR